MEFCAGSAGQEREIVELFTATFAAAEGEEEGATVGGLARDLLASTPADDLLVFSVVEGRDLLGCIMFSRIRFEGEGRRVFLLSPVAVRTDRQREGIGQRLLAHGLDALRQAGVDFAMTYGDPAYYRQVGFQPMSEEFAPPPFKLSYPHGWLGQPLNDSGMVAFKGAARCVEALNDPAVW